MQNLNSPVKKGPDGYHIQNISLTKIANEFGTPLYIYDLDHVVACYKSLFEAITWPKLKILFAMKANYNLDILKALKAEGASIDAVSPAEIFVAQKAGFTSRDILYTAYNMPDEDIRLVHEQGILLNIDSLSVLKRYGEIFPGSDVCLRFNPDVVAGEHEKVQTGGDKTKFGIHLEDAAEARALVERYNLKVVGLHKHTGSGIAEADKFLQSMKNLLSIAKKEWFPDLQFADFGGGFKVPYHPEEKRIDYRDFGQKVTALFEEFCRVYGRELDLCFEPGKYMVAESGIFLTRVNMIKNNKSRLIAGTDSGFGHLIRPTLYDAYHHILNVTNPEGTPRMYDVCGNICESGDLFASDRVIPEIREGDVLALLNSGAYCFSMASIYNLRPLPAEVVIKNGKVRLSRGKSSHEMLANEICTAYQA